MYTVIGSPQTRALRVIWMLEELGLAYEIDPLPPRDPKLAAINPAGKVPILKEGDDTITDSVAICQYLADKHAALTFPAGTIARAHQDSFTQFCVDEIEGSLWQAAKHTFVLPKEMRIAEAKIGCKHDFDRALQSLDLRLGDKPNVMGDTFTVPDLLLGHCALWAKRMGWNVPEGRVADYFARALGRPAALKAIATRGTS